MKTLLVIDRATGDFEAIEESAGSFRESIALAAGAIGISPAEALSRLEAGETLVTSGCLRRLITEDEAEPRAVGLAAVLIPVMTMIGWMLGVLTMLR